MVGLGFFSVELGIILISGAITKIEPLGEIALIHIGTAGLIGYVVATRNPGKAATFLSAVFFASVFHAAYNFLTIDRTFILNYAVFALLTILMISSIANIMRLPSKLR